MRTDSQILKRITELGKSDLFGTQQADLVCRLPFTAVRPMLKENSAQADWKVQPRDDASIKAEMQKYMRFAWDKANNRRGLSAGRSMAHMSTCLWLLGHDEAADAVLTYDMYGKNWLRAICEAFGWDWRQWDDGRWSNDEEHNGAPAPQTVAPLPLTPSSSSDTADDA